MAKTARATFFCGECGHESPKWLGNCPGCGSWNTMVESSALQVKAGGLRTQAQPLSSVQDDDLRRYGTGMQELDRVLGGGLCRGMAVLLGGDPGIGKSTLLLQVAGHLASSGATLYVSGEESAAQIKSRATRLGVKSDMLLINETDIAAIEAEIDRLRPQFLLVDSIQTMHSQDLSGSAGSVSQVREGTATFIKIAKRTGAAVLIVGHVTKDGAIAGPRILEHMVDTVLYFEGEHHADLRLLRAVKNRFGSINEVGVFEMCETGMRQVRDPSRLFLSGQHMPGCAVTCALEGTRPMLAEVQALLSLSPFGAPRRMATGIDPGRLNLLLAVLENKARVGASNKDVYVNVVGGLRLIERAVDLSVALCVASCVKNRPLFENTAAIGEIGLTGEVRAVSQMEKRMRECVRLGFSNLIVPKLDAKYNVPGANLTPVRNVAEAAALL
ncbi:MAG: DNA repair protein RadA [Clostridiales bacterium]|jgi:DNA repair protein RadA/Sms|nr:DNA repair protein RadA [Clostridiales bacterium]